MKINVSSTNLDKWNINWKDISDIVICRHEIIHTRIFTTTLYGSFQRFFNGLKEHIEEDSDLQNQLLALNYELYKESDFAHEVAATYCSVKQLDAELIKGYLSTLPSSYMEYYNVLSKLIDPNIESTFAQYLVGEMLLTICFNPDIEESIESNWNNNYSLDPRDSPNKRLNIILNAIKHSDFVGLDSKINEFISLNYLELGIKDNFNYQMEDHWKKVDGSRLIYLNRELGKHIYIYFSELLSERNLLNVTSTIGQLESIDRIMEDLDGPLAEKISNESKLDNFKITNLQQDLEEILENTLINDSVISNKVILEFKKRKKNGIYRGGDWLSLTEQSLIHSDRILDVEKSDLWFAIKTQKVDYTLSACTLNKDVYLNTINGTGTTGFLTPPIDTNIIGIEANCILDTKESIENRVVSIIQSIYSDIQDFKLSKNNKQRNIQRHLEPKFKNIVWYMHGDFVAWFNFLLSIKKLKFFVVHFDDQNSTNRKVLIPKKNQSILKESVYFGALVFYSEMLPGTFIRFYNINSYHLALLRIIPFIDNGKISVDDPSRRRYYEQQVIRSFKVIESAWEVY